MFYKRLLQAFNGRKIWCRITKSYNLAEKDYVLVELTEDKELIHWGNQYLEQFISENKIERIIVLRKSEKKPCLHHSRVEYVECSKKELEDVVAFYCMYYFSNRFLIFDTMYPDTNKLGNLVLNNVMDKEEIVAIGLFGLGSVEKNVTR